MWNVNLESTILTPVQSMLDMLGGYFPTIFSAIVIFGVGYVVAKFLRLSVEHVLDAVGFEDLAKKLGITGFLKDGKVKLTPTKVVGALTYHISMIMVLLLVLPILGVAAGMHLIDGFIGYIPSVITACFVLVLGLFLARFVSMIIRVVANNTDLPRPEIIETLGHWAMVLFTITITLKELGLHMLFEGQTFTILFAGIILALSLAFGLGGRGIAEKYLKVLTK